MQMYKPAGGGYKEHHYTVVEEADYVYKDDFLYNKGSTMKPGQCFGPTKHNYNQINHGYNGGGYDQNKHSYNGDYDQNKHGHEDYYNGGAHSQNKHGREDYGTSKHSESSWYEEERNMMENNYSSGHKGNKHKAGMNGGFLANQFLANQGPRMPMGEHQGNYYSDHGKRAPAWDCKGIDD